MRKNIGVIQWVKKEEDFHGNLKLRSFEKSNREPNKLKYVGNIIFIQYWSIFGNGNIMNLQRLRSKSMEGNTRMKQKSQSFEQLVGKLYIENEFLKKTLMQLEKHGKTEEGGEET